MKFFKSPWFKVLLIAVFVGVVFLILSKFNINFSGITEEEFKEKVNSFGIWGPVLYIIVYVLRPLILFPAGVLSASAGLIWGPAKGFFILQIGANISSTVEFLIARSFGREAIKKHLKGKMANLDENIEKHGFLTVLLIRLIPNAPWDIQNLGLGLTHVRFRDYFFATLIGIMPGSFAFVYFGSSLIKVLFNPKNFWMIIVAILLFTGIYFLQKYLRGKKGV